VQQKQRRVRPSFQMKAGVPINDDKALENEADKMSLKANQDLTFPSYHNPAPCDLNANLASPVQRVIHLNEETDEQMPDEVLEEAISRFPAGIQEAIREIHQNDEYAFTLEQAIVFAKSVVIKEGPKLFPHLDENESSKVARLLQSGDDDSGMLEEDVPIEESQIKNKELKSIINALMKQAANDFSSNQDDPNYKEEAGYNDALQEAIECVRETYGGGIESYAQITGDRSVVENLESTNIAHSKTRIETVSDEYRREQGDLALNWYISNDAKISDIIERLRKFHRGSSLGTIAQAYEVAIRKRLTKEQLNLLAAVRLNWGPITVGSTVYMEMRRGSLKQYQKNNWLKETLVHEVIHSAEHPYFTEFLEHYIPDHLQSNIREGITEYLAMYALGKSDESSEAYEGQKSMIDNIINLLPNGFERLQEAYWLGNVAAFLPVMLKDFERGSKDESEAEEVQIIQGVGSFSIGTASGNGLNCLIDSIGQALRIKTSSLERGRIRNTLIELGWALEGDLLWNDQNVLSAIIQSLGRNPAEITIVFINDMGAVDDQTYNFGDETIYIRNRGNVHFDPMFRKDD